MTNNPQPAIWDSQSSRIGLIAGWGRYPIVVAQTLKAQGKQVYCVGIENHADPSLAAAAIVRPWGSS